MKTSTGPAAKKNGGTIIPPMSQEDIDTAMRQARTLIDGGVTKTAEAAKAVISAPRMCYATLTIRGIAPYVQHAFSQKAQAQMEATQRAGTQARSRKKREARDFEASYESAMHKAKGGWHGIPATKYPQRDDPAPPLGRFSPVAGEDIGLCRGQWL